MAERRYEQEIERLNAALASLVPSEPVSTALRKLYWPTGTTRSSSAVRFRPSRMHALI
jgi:hypothetical protein